MQTITTFTDRKEDFITSLNDGFYAIVRNNDGLFKLVFGDDDFHGTTKIEELLIGNPTFSTYRLRQYCEEFHPGIDFDKEFETDTPGVYDRYQERFDHDYEEWVRNEIYKELKESLKAKGYTLLLE